MGRTGGAFYARGAAKIVRPWDSTTSKRPLVSTRPRCSGIGMWPLCMKSRPSGLKCT
jgi:hypothetical protein